MAPTESVAYRRYRFHGRVDRSAAAPSELSNWSSEDLSESDFLQPALEESIASQLLVALVPPTAKGERKKLLAETLLRIPIRTEPDRLTIHWQPGRAVIEGGYPAMEQCIPSLLDFAANEERLHGLEKRVQECAHVAPMDVKFSYRINYRNRREWPRLGERMEELARIRFEFLALETRLSRPPASLPAFEKRLALRLAKKSSIEDRLEALDNRLEVCEDLYEGATDRITDYRWYFKGFWLESIIIILLALEVILMSIDLYFRFLEYKAG